jgi:hypothetical protein
MSFTIHGAIPTTIITTLAMAHGVVVTRLRTEGDTLQVFLTFVDGRTLDTQFLWTTFTPNDNDINIDHQAVCVPRDQHEPFTVRTGHTATQHAPEDEGPPAPPYTPAPIQTVPGGPPEEPEEIHIIATAPAQPPAVEEPGSVEEDAGSEQYWDGIDWAD